jgi:hypothetical protein
VKKEGRKGRAIKKVSYLFLTKIQLLAFQSHIPQADCLFQLLDFAEAKSPKAKPNRFNSREITM